MGEDAGTRRVIVSKRARHCSDSHTNISAVLVCVPMLYIISDMLARGYHHCCCRWWRTAWLPAGEFAIKFMRARSMPASMIFITDCDWAGLIELPLVGFEFLRNWTGVRMRVNLNYWSYTNYWWVCLYKVIRWKSNFYHSSSAHHKKINNLQSC